MPTLFNWTISFLFHPLTRDFFQYIFQRVNPVPFYLFNSSYQLREENQSRVREKRLNRGSENPTFSLIARSWKAYCVGLRFLFPALQCFILFWLFLFLLLLFRTAVDPRDKLPPRVVPTRILGSQEQKDSCNIARVLKVFAFGHVNSLRLYFHSLICTLLLFFWYST